MKMDELGKQLYDVLGGRENILQAYNCMTRLRVQLKEKDEKLLEAVKQVPGVMGIHDTEEELQIILGPGTATQVTTVVNELLENTKANRHFYPADSCIYRLRLAHRDTRRIG